MKPLAGELMSSPSSTSFRESRAPDPTPAHITRRSKSDILVAGRHYLELLLYLSAADRLANDFASVHNYQEIAGFRPHIAIRPRKSTQTDSALLTFSINLLKRALSILCGRKSVRVQVLKLETAKRLSKVCVHDGRRIRKKRWKSQKIPLKKLLMM